MQSGDWRRPNERREYATVDRWVAEGNSPAGLDGLAGVAGVTPLGKPAGALSTGVSNVAAPPVADDSRSMHKSSGDLSGIDAAVNVRGGGAGCFQKSTLLLQTFCCSFFGFGAVCGYAFGVRSTCAGREYNSKEHASTQEHASIQGATTLSSYHFLGSPRSNELGEKLRASYLADGAAQTLRLADLWIQTDNEFSSACHPMLHAFGNWVRMTERDNLTKALGDFFHDKTLGNNSHRAGTTDAWMLTVCNGAYLHGVTESYIKFSDDLHRAVQDVNELVCLPLRHPSTPPAPIGAVFKLSVVWECDHGLGHGITQHLRRKSKFQSLQNVVQFARQTSNTFQVQAQTVINGMWMEHHADTSFVDHALTNEPERAFGLCNDIRDEHWACMHYAVTSFLLHEP